MSFDLAVVPPGIAKEVDAGGRVFGMRVIESPFATMKVHTGGHLKPAWDIYLGRHYTIEEIYEQRPCAFLIDSSILNHALHFREGRPKYDGIRVKDLLIDPSRMAVIYYS